MAYLIPGTGHDLSMCLVYPLLLFIIVNYLPLVYVFRVVYNMR